MGKTLCSSDFIPFQFGSAIIPIGVTGKKGGEHDPYMKQLYSIITLDAYLLTVSC